jgi:dTMP kinase
MLFITFEGGEGCGKSTQTRILYRSLQKLAVPALLTHEPGVTALGKKADRLLKWSHDIAISPVAELLLFNVSRAQLVTEVLKPELVKGTVVICDRYTDSTIAYQSYGRGLDLEMVKTVNNISTQGLSPNLTVLLDVPPETGFKRKQDDKPDRFESLDMAFHHRVRKGYLDLAKGEPERWLVIDGLQSKEAISGIIWQAVSKLLKQEKVK